MILDMANKVHRSNPHLAKQKLCDTVEAETTKVYELINRPILEHLEDLKNKLRLVDGESKSFYENSYRYLKEAYEQARKLRDRNQELRERLVPCSANIELVLDNVIQDKAEQLLLINQTTSDKKLEVLDEIVLNRLKQLNLLQYQTRQKEDKLSALELEIQQLQSSLNEGQSSNTWTLNLEQNIRLLENKIEKAKVKNVEVAHIACTYETILEKFKEESMIYARTSKTMESEVERCAEKLKELKQVYEDAALLRDKAKTELQRHEELFYAHRQRREMEIMNLRKVVDTKKETYFLQKNPMMDQELKKLDADVSGEEIEEETMPESQNRVTYCEAVYEKLKELTGLDDLSDIVRRFEKQKIAFAHLSELRTTTEQAIAQLRAKHKNLRSEIEQLKEEHAKKHERLKFTKQETNQLNDDLANLQSDNQKKLNELERILSQACVAAEHLFNKLSLTRVISKRDKSRILDQKIFSRDMTIMELLTRCMELQDQLQTDLEDYDLVEESERLTDAIEESLRTRGEYRMSVERRLPMNSSRIQLVSTESNFGEEAMGEETEALTRDEIKQRASIMRQNRKKHLMNTR